MKTAVYGTVIQALIAALPALCPAPAAAQEPETNYQRYDIVRETSELTVESSFRYWTEQAEGGSAHSIRLGARVEYVFKTNHSAAVSLPYTLALYNHPEARRTAFYSPGDLELSYEYLKQFGHINLFAGPFCAIPLAETNEYAAREGVYSASSGRYSAGIGVSITGIRDPVVWNVGFQYAVGLPKEERFYAAWQPGNFQVSAGFSHLINHRIGVSLGLTQKLGLPEIKDVRWDNGVTVSTAIKGEYIILYEKDYARVSVETLLYPQGQPFIIGLSYGHKFVF